MITSFGKGVDNFWDIISSYKIIADVKDDREPLIKDNESVCESINLLCEDAIRETLRRINISEKSIANNKRIGIILASSLGAIDLGYSKDSIRIDNKIKNYGRISSITAHLVEKFNIKGFSTTVTNTCVSGASALLIGQQLIKNNILDQCFIVGFDYISRFISDGFKSLKILNESNKMSYFSDDKQGILLGEGVGVLLIGKNKITDKDIKIKSVAISNDSHDIVKPCETGNGLNLAINEALKKSNYRWSDLDIIYIGSNGTKIIDDINNNLLNYIFERYDMQAKITSIKHLIGHTLGASNIIELIALFLMMNNHFVPTITTNINSSNINMDIYTNKFGNSYFKRAMLFSSGFTAVNCSIVLEGEN